MLCYEADMKLIIGKDLVFSCKALKHVFKYFNFQKSASDASNFDEDFTNEKAQLTPVHDKNLLASIDPEAFLNFSYTNPNFSK